MLVNDNYDIPDLHLKMTTMVESIPTLPYDLLKYNKDYSDIPFLNKILIQNYELLTFSSIRHFIELNKTTTKKHLKIEYDNLFIDNYILSPLSLEYKTKSSVLSITYYFYHTITSILPKNKKMTIFKAVSDSNLNIWFDMEDFLMKHKDYQSDHIKTVFIYIGDHYDEYIKEHKINSLYDYIIYDYKHDTIETIEKFIGMNDAIYIGTVRLYHLFHTDMCFFDSLNLPYLLFLLSISLKHLNVNGDLFMYHLFPPIHLSFIGMIYYVFTLFHDLSIHSNPFHLNHLGLMHFKHYKHKSKLMSITNKYKKIDPLFGYDNHIKPMIQPIDYCHLIINKNNQSQMIYSIVDMIHPNFINYYYTHCLSITDRIKKMIDKSKTIKMKNIHSILSYNIESCIEFCHKHNIKIEKYYQSFKPLNYKNIIQSFFIHKKGLDYHKLMIQVDSIYSITYPEDSIDLCKYIQHEFPNVTMIIDGTSNVGTNTIVMSYYFDHIIACEINKKTFTMLKNNISVYDINNIKLYHDSIISLMKQLNYDPLSTCLYLDPPWTGIYYKLEDSIDLMLDDMNIIDFIHSISIQYICLKVPFNYNIKSLFRKFKLIKLYNLSSFYCILLTK
jgi:RNA cap guanine-N2 methyltransferase